MIMSVRYFLLYDEKHRDDYCNVKFSITRKPHFIYPVFIL